MSRALQHSSPATGYIPPDERWTTGDELGHIRSLYRDRKINALRGWVAQAPHRCWTGVGMSVDAALVIMTGKDLLANLEAELRAEKLGRELEKRGADAARR